MRETELIKVDFNKPYIAQNEFAYLKAAIESNHISGDGQFTRKCNQYLETTLGVHKALITTNCTHALEMSAILLNLKPGDEVIVPIIHICFNSKRLYPERCKTCVR